MDVSRSVQPEFKNSEKSAVVVVVVQPVSKLAITHMGHGNCGQQRSIFCRCSIAVGQTPGVSS
jgi:hypothetical protein